MQSNPLELTELFVKDLSKYEVTSFYGFNKQKKYFLVTKEGLHIELGYFIKYENKSIIDRICWHDGPTYSKMQWHLEFSNFYTDEDLKKEFDLIETKDFYEKYLGFYEYP